jgi:hypothetical protein
MVKSNLRTVLLAWFPFSGPEYIITGYTGIMNNNALIIPMRKGTTSTQTFHLSLAAFQGDGQQLQPSESKR